MSSPPEYPGRRHLEKRVERLKGAPGGRAYEGAFEAVGAILIATLLGTWFDQHYETTPTGVLVGAGIGFAAFVLRLVRLGKQLHGDPGSDADAKSASAAHDAGHEHEDGSAGPGENPGLAGILSEDEDEPATPRKH